MFLRWSKRFTAIPKPCADDFLGGRIHLHRNQAKKPKNLNIFGFFLLTYAQKFISCFLKFSDALRRLHDAAIFHKSLILFRFIFMLSSQAIQSNPYFSRLCEASCRVFNKVIHSFLGHLLKILKNNNLPVFPRNFMSYEPSELRSLTSVSVNTRL